MLIKQIVNLIFISFIGFTSFSQFSNNEEQEMTGRKFWDRLYTGGGLSLNFGSFTYIDVSPVLGYQVTNDFSVGIGGKYVYISDNISRFKTSMYGGSVFGRYLIAENFLAHAEFEAINVEVRQLIGPETKRTWVPVGLVGGGYRQNFGRRSYIQAMLLYDLIDDPNSPYRGTSIFGPDIPLYLRFGFIIGI